MTDLSKLLDEGQRLCDDATEAAVAAAISQCDTTNRAARTAGVFSEWLHTHAPTLIAAAREGVRLREADDSLAREVAAHGRTVDERESVVDAITRAYSLVVGESPTWSSRFGYAEALGDIENALQALRRAVQQSGSADSLKAECKSLSRTCELMLKRNDFLEEEVVNRSRRHEDVVKTYHEKLKSTEARRVSLLTALDRIREQLEDSQVADENEGDYGERIELLLGIVKEVL